MSELLMLIVLFRKSLELVTSGRPLVDKFYSILFRRLFNILAKIDFTLFGSALAQFG